MSRRRERSGSARRGWPGPLAAALAALALGLGLRADAARAGDFEPVFVGLGVLKVPGIAFDAVAMAQAGPVLRTTEGSDAFRRALTTSFVANGVTLGLHGVSVAAFLASGFDELEEEESLAVSFLVNGGCDLGIAVLGLASGIDLLQRRRASGLEGTDLGISAGWSGLVNVVMGGFGAAWFGPMFVGALLAADELDGQGPRDGGSYAPEPAPSELRLRSVQDARPRLRARIAPTGSGFVLVGTF